MNLSDDVKRLEELSDIVPEAKSLLERLAAVFYPKAEPIARKHRFQLTEHQNVRYCRKCHAPAILVPALGVCQKCAPAIIDALEPKVSYTIFWNGKKIASGKSSVPYTIFYKIAESRKATHWHVDNSSGWYEDNNGNKLHMETKN